MDEVKAQEVRVPPMGDFADVLVGEVLVQPGDDVAADQSLVVLESDKATVDVPSPVAGRIREVLVEVGARVSEGALIAVLEASGQDQADVTHPAPAIDETLPRPAAPAGPMIDSGEPPVRASPAVRLLARELGADLSEVPGSGPARRVLKSDIHQFAQRMQGRDMTAEPANDFATYGPVEVQKLSRIRVASGLRVLQSWQTIPHVTSYDDADVTEIERLRRSLNDERAGRQPKLTLLAFVLKAAASALGDHPNFNASLSRQDLYLKQYYHIGFAVDTPNGLTVPVVRDVDRRGITEIAGDIEELAELARAGQLRPVDMRGGSFTVSSLGGHPGRGFTPIINHPEVAILGVSRTRITPVWDGESFQPRLMLPLSLSWDHRVIDGVAAAKFAARVADLLAEPARMLM